MGKSCLALVGKKLSKRARQRRTVKSTPLGTGMVATYHLPRVEFPEWGRWCGYCGSCNHLHFLRGWNFSMSPHETTPCGRWNKIFSQDKTKVTGLDWSDWVIKEELDSRPNIIICNMLCQCECSHPVSLGCEQTGNLSERKWMYVWDDHVCWWKGDEYGVWVCWRFWMVAYKLLTQTDAISCAWPSSSATSPWSPAMLSTTMTRPSTDVVLLLWSRGVPIWLKFNSCHASWVANGMGI